MIFKIFKVTVIINLLISAIVSLYFFAVFNYYFLNPVLNLKQNIANSIYNKVPNFLKRKKSETSKTWEIKKFS